MRGQPIALERRPFNLLVLLVARHGQVVLREEIVAALWPGNVLIDFEAGVNTLVRKIRQALGDSSDKPACIETVPGRGYRFIAPVTERTMDDPLPAATMPATRQRRSTWVAALATLIAILGVLFWTVRADDPASTSIAVLPFEDHTGSVELGYLASGLAEEVSASLTQIDPVHLRVIGDVSAKALRESTRPLPEIGRELGVEWVIRSSLHAEDSRIRVNASLVRVRDNQQVWAAAFDRELLNMLGLQRELSIAIAEQVRLQLSPDVAAELDRRQTNNPEAYALYLKGRHAWRQFNPAANQEALRLYRLAVQQDPGYALAWAGIAQALASAPMTTDVDPAEITVSARDAARRAVKHGPDLAEARYAEAYVHLFLDWDLPAAEAAARRSVLLDPNNALANLFLGVVLYQAGDSAEASAMMRRARVLDPMFAHTFALSSMLASQIGDYASALELAKQAIAISPDIWVGYLHLGTAQMALGEQSSALDAFARAQRLSRGNSKAIASNAYLLGKMGRTDEARTLMAELERRTHDRYVPPYAFAVMHAGLGETDAAFDWLERALAARDVHVLGLHRDPRLALLRDDPRFQAILRRCRCTPL